MASETASWALVAPPEEDVGGGEALGGEAVVGLVEGGGGGLDACSPARARGQGGVDAVGVDGADGGVLALVDEFVPDDGSDHGVPRGGGPVGEGPAGGECRGREWVQGGVCTRSAHSVQRG